MAAGGQRGSAEVVGAAASAAATTEALATLVDVVCTTLGDAACADILAADPQAAAALQARAPAGNAVEAAKPLGSLQEAMQQLALVAAAASGGDGTSSARHEPGAGNESVAAAKPRAPLIPPPGRLHIERSAEWVVASASKVQTVLAVSLPPLMSHPRPSVRTALAAGARCVG